MNTISYRGYAARVEFDADDNLFVGRVVGLSDSVGFHADNTSGLVDAFREAVDDYLEACEAVGKRPEKPYSGQLMVRVDPTVHARAALAAELTGRSLARWAEDHLRQAAEADLKAAVAI